MPNFIEIGVGSRKFSKKLVDLTRNDPGVPLAHGQFITVLFNLFVTFVHILPTCILYYVYLMLLAIGPNKVFLIPDS